VKRTLIAAVLAIGIHAIFLGVDFNRNNLIFADMPIPRVMTMTLASWQPRKPVVNMQNVPLETPIRFKTPRPMLKEQITQPIPLQPDTTSRPLSTASVAETVDNYKPAPETGLTDLETSKPIDRGSRDQSASLFMQEAKPLYQTNPAPIYPRMARRRGYQGNVVLKVLVSRNGSVSDLKVSTSSGYPVLDQAAIDSVKKWTFVPGMRGHENVEMWVRVPIRFELE
jgi:protein TonB